jgi:hypothetical protein
MRDGRPDLLHAAIRAFEKVAYACEESGQIGGLGVVAQTGEARSQRLSRDEKFLEHNGDHLATRMVSMVLSSVAAPSLSAEGSAPARA